MEKKHNKELVSISQLLRKNMTKEERKLWYEYLKDYPIRIRRQKVIGKYVVDFYCAKKNVVIELDGSQHYESKEIIRDNERTQYLQQFGIKVVRIANNEVMKNFVGVCEYIDEILRDNFD